ncbi:hypothetical protein MO767_18285 [Pseudomonas sp. UYIF39]|uniref:hypothetical protein n=1 Tax=Pseudomonas sp. UYIF39 TaxID=1630747 RepID=UPI00249F2C74|nr:hypothetical protein [Pseudomonas sp. UYIF39]MDI3356284.1 hypothetical protein [Pseudomonas sp. UYIF39]
MKVFLLTIFFILAGCNESQSALEHPSMTNQSQTIEVKFLAPLKNTTTTSPTPFTESCLSQVDVCWYKIQKSANDKNLPTLNVTVNERALTLEQAVNTSIVVDKKKSENIETLNVILRGLPKGSTHEEYRELIFNLVDKIKDAGWSHFFLPEDPRISGSQANKINSPDSVLGQSVSSHPWLDPDYQVDLKRWLQIGPMYNWYFYNTGAYLHLKAWKQNDEEAPTAKATYLIILEFQSEKEFWLSGITDEKERSHWKELLPKRLEGYHAARLALEEKARAAGIDIDETYQDPPIKALE